MYKQEKKEEMAEEFLLKGSHAKLLAAFTLDDETEWRVALVWRHIEQNSERKMFDIEEHPDIRFISLSCGNTSYVSQFSIPKRKITKAWNDECLIIGISMWGKHRQISSGTIWTNTR
jgi:hypothetical protein